MTEMSDVDPGSYIRQLTGTPVARQSNVSRCTTCGAFLADGADITAYAYRLSDEPRLRIARLYCAACDYQTIEHPTLGAEEVVVSASLTTCHERLVLSDIEVCDWSRKVGGDTL